MSDFNKESLKEKLMGGCKAILIGDKSASLSQRCVGVALAVAITAPVVAGSVAGLKGLSGVTDDLVNRGFLPEKQQVQFPESLAENRGFSLPDAADIRALFPEKKQVVFPESSADDKGFSLPDAATIRGLFPEKKQVVFPDRSSAQAPFGGGADAKNQAMSKFASKALEANLSSDDDEPSFG